MVKKDNLFPYIIAIGPTKDRIIKFYIDVEKNLIPVRDTFKSVELIEYLFTTNESKYFQMPD